MTIITLNSWDYSYIRQLAEEATFLARQEGLHPVPASEVIKTYKHSHRFNIPFLGDYIPEGWKEVLATLPIHVDTTGKGKPRQCLILTQREFFEIANQDKEVGYGVIEQHQTHVIIATYRKEVYRYGNTDDLVQNRL